MIFLDTNVVIAVMTRRSPLIVQRLEAEVARGTSLQLPAIVVWELNCGARKSANPQRNLSRLEEFMRVIADVPAFDADDAVEAGEIRASLELQGTPIGPCDILIAAQARRRNVILVTGNRREFDRVTGLMVTDWGASIG